MEQLGVPIVEANCHIGEIIDILDYEGIVEFKKSQRQDWLSCALGDLPVGCTENGPVSPDRD